MSGIPAGAHFPHNRGGSGSGTADGGKYHEQARNWHEVHRGVSGNAGDYGAWPVTNEGFASSDAPLGGSQSDAGTWKGSMGGGSQLPLGNYICGRLSTCSSANQAPTHAWPAPIAVACGETVLFYYLERSNKSKRLRTSLIH